MRATLVTGSLLLGVAAIVVLPALAARSRPAARPSPESASSASGQARQAPVRKAFPDTLGPAASQARRGNWKQVIVDLALVKAASPREAALRDALAAEALARSGESEQAEALARRVLAAGAKDRHLEARASLLVAEMRAAAGDADAAAALAAPALTSTPALAQRAALVRGGALLATEPGQALLAVAPVAGAPAASPGILALAAEAAAAAKSPAQAAEFRRRLHVEHPASEEARASAQPGVVAEETRRALAAGRADDVLRRAERLLDAKLNDLAHADLSVALATDAAGPAQPRLELMMGRVERARGQNAKALAHLAKAAKADGPDGCRAALNASMAAKSLRRTGDASTWLARAASGCDCEWRDMAARQAARAAEGADKPAEARRLWTLLARRGHAPKERTQAAWRMAWADWTSGRQEQAIAEMQALVADAPESREAAGARYWTSRHARESGDAERSDAILAALASDFPREWYGLLAASEAGLAIPPPASCVNDDTGSALAHAALAVLGEGELASAVLDVEALGLVEDALLEADASSAAPSDLATYRALVLSRAGRSREALREFRRAVPDWRRRADVDPALACAAWPLHHEELILRSSREKGLDPALVFGLVHQESVFDAQAISHAGARGLMQVMPATGQTIARWLGERVTTARLLEPEVNVRYGTTYLRRLLDESGRVEVALAGYNAGPGRARRWWAASDGDVAFFVENIPFDETRDYVKAIAVNELLYRVHLAERAAEAGQ